MRRGKFQEVKVVEIEKGTISRSWDSWKWEGNNFKKLRLLKMRKGKFQEVKILENEKGQVSRSLSLKDWVSDWMQKEEKRILIGRIVYTSSIASIYVWSYIIW